jgi:hypothetical protein
MTRDNPLFARLHEYMNRANRLRIQRSKFIRSAKKTGLFSSKTVKSAMELGVEHLYKSALEMLGSAWLDYMEYDEGEAKVKKKKAGTRKKKRTRNVTRKAQRRNQKEDVRDPQQSH